MEQSHGSIHTVDNRLCLNWEGDRSVVDDLATELLKNTITLSSSPEVAASERRLLEAFTECAQHRQRIHDADRINMCRDLVAEILRGARDMRASYHVRLNSDIRYTEYVPITGFRIAASRVYVACVMLYIETPIGVLDYVIEPVLGIGSKVFSPSFCDFDLTLPHFDEKEQPTLRQLAFRQVAAAFVSSSGSWEADDFAGKRLFGDFYRAHNEDWVTPELDKRRALKRKAEEEEEEGRIAKRPRLLDVSV
jgi:hypothetical protein